MKTLKSILPTIIIIVIVLGFILGVVKLASWSETDNERIKQERKEKLFECLYRAGDENLDWCYDNFVR